MTVLVPRMDILPPAQMRLWPELQPAANLGFVLYGGTAIALRLGHRQSVDFDFFTDRPLDRDALHSAFPFLANSQVLQDQPNTYCVLAPTAMTSGRTSRSRFSAASVSGVLQSLSGRTTRICSLHRLTI